MKSDLDYICKYFFSYFIITIDGHFRCYIQFKPRDEYGNYMNYVLGPLFNNNVFMDKRIIPNNNLLNNMYRACKLNSKSDI